MYYKFENEFENELVIEISPYFGQFHEWMRLKYTSWNNLCTIIASQTNKCNLYRSKISIARVKILDLFKSILIKIIFYKTRDISQIQTLARQTGLNKTLNESYSDAMTESFGYNYSYWSSP